MSSLFFPDFYILAFWSPGPAEMMVLAVVALLLYGGNLPEVARSWGKTFAEFRRGLTGFQSEMNNVIYNEPEKIAYQDDHYRDDSSYASGYEEPDSYQDDNGQDDASQNESEAQQDKTDESEITVNDAGTDTIVVEKKVEEGAKEEIEAKPTD